MRLFIAVSLPDELKERLKEDLQKLSAASRRETVDVKWVKPEQFHFTLKFLGECSEAQVPETVQALESAVEGIRPFTVKIGGMGCFPDRGPVSIVWLGLLEGSEPMTTLAAQVESGCELAGFPPSERPFSAHLTLGRVKDLKNSGKLRPLIESSPQADLDVLHVDSIELIRSILSPQGPTYTVLNSFKLR